MNGKEKTQTEKLRDEILKMGKNELFLRYKNKYLFTVEHEHDSPLRNDKIQSIITLTAAIAIMALVLPIIYFWVTGKTFSPEFLSIIVVAVGLILFLINLGLYMSDKADLDEASIFMGAVDDIYPGFHQFVKDHLEDEFIPPYSLFPLRSDFIEIGRPYKTDDGFINRTYTKDVKVEKLSADEAEVVNLNRIRTPRPTKKSKPAKMPALEMKPDPKEVLVILNGKRYTRRDIEKIIKDIHLEDIKPEDVTEEMLEFLIS